MTTAVSPDSPVEQAAMDLLRMTGGLILTHCLYVAATLGIADLLKNRAGSTAELAAALHVHEEALYRVLRLLSGQGVFEEVGCRTFANTRLSECLRTDVVRSVRSLLILRGVPETAAAMLAVTGGKERTLEQHRNLLGSADFNLRRTQRFRSPIHSRIESPAAARALSA